MRVNISGVESTNAREKYLFSSEYIEPLSKKHPNEIKKVNLKIVKNYEDLSDNVLVDLFVQNSDEMAFNEIFNRYYQKTRNLALKILADVDEAEDIVQEVFVTLLKSMNGFRGESKFSTWLYAITLNTIRMRLREKTKNQKAISFDDDNYINSLENTVSKQYFKNGRLNNPEDININKEFMKKLHLALEVIPKKYKDVFVLRDFQQLSNQEVADQLGVSLSAVKSRLHRARHYLRTNFNEY